MRAWLLREFKGIESLELSNVPVPTPGPGEVLLQLSHAALNPADRYLAERLYPAHPPLPHILGRDGIGRVVKATPEHPELEGARCAILRGHTGGDRPGTFAEYVAVPETDLAGVPPDWTDEEGAGATLVYLTAYQALRMWGPLRPGAVVLITGASGGVGVAAVQLAAAMKQKVFALSRSAEKGARLRQLGADQVFDPEDPDWRKKAKAAAGPERVSLAIDNIGGKLLPQVIDTLGESGRVSLVGRLAGPVPDFNTATLFFRRIRMGGVAVGAWTKTESRDAWARVLELLAQTRARPLVDRVFPFEQLPRAFARLQEGPLGKVLLRVGKSPS